VGRPCADRMPIPERPPDAAIEDEIEEGRADELESALELGVVDVLPATSPLAGGEGQQDREGPITPPRGSAYAFSIAWSRPSA